MLRSYGINKSGIHTYELVGFSFLDATGIYFTNVQFLFLATTDNIVNGRLYNTVEGRTNEYLIVTGDFGEETYQCPDTQDYKDADVDNIWFKPDGERRIVSRIELICYDLSRTPVKYDNEEPVQIRTIGILAVGYTYNENEKDSLYFTFQLPIWWDGNENDNGYLKDKEIVGDGLGLSYAQNLWLPIPPAPTDLAGVQLSGTSGEITWNDTYGQISIERSANDTAHYVEVHTMLTGLNYWKDESLSADTKYYYRLRAYNALGYSSYSNEINFTTPATAFVTKWKTNNAGVTGSTSIGIPTNGSGYDCYIDWKGDGSDVEHVTGTPGRIDHDYGVAGTYTVKITGTFPNIYFFTAGDCLKLVEVSNWGINKWTSMAYAFLNCSNAVGTWSDNPDLSLCTSFVDFARGSNVLNRSQINNWDTHTITNMNEFANRNAFNQDISNWDWSNVTTALAMFIGNYAFSRTNYDKLLISLAAQAVNNNVNFNALHTQYTLGGAAEAAHIHLTTPVISGGHGWTITDAGGV